MNGMRIAQVAPLWMSVPPDRYGGTERMVHSLCEGLIDRGCDVTLFASGDSRTRARLRKVCRTNVSSMMAAGTAYEYEHYANAAYADAIACSGDFDLIHCHLGFQQVPLSQLSRAPVLHTFHITPSIDDCWVLDRYRDVAVAAASAAQVAPVKPERRKSIRVIPHGIDFGAYPAGLERGTFLVFLARMSPQKSPVHAVRIAEQAGMPLVLAGAPLNQAERDYFDREVRPLIDGERVRHVGLVDHKAKCDLLRNAAALLFPIQGEEAFGLAMIEAMACGTPVIGWNRASVPEIIDPGVTGFYGDSIEALAAQVKGARSLDRHRVREHARRRFDLPRMVDDYAHLYHELAEAAAATRP
jgi:glycosyltransferase involved in cell wall biosynthesis